MSEIEELKRIIEILDQEGVDKCNKIEAQAKQIKKLEKALDKACQYLDDFSNTYECYHPNQQDPFWKEQWKEHILEEVQ